MNLMSLNLVHGQFMKVHDGKGVPELRGPALGCMSAIDENATYIFCKDNCIDLPHGH